MSFFGKIYRFQKHENYDELLKTVGIPEDKAALVASAKSATKIVQNGDSYVVTQYSWKGEKETIFKSGVEIDDTIGEEAIPIKTTYTVDGNTVTQVVSNARGTATYKREYNGDDLVVTVTANKYDGVAKRYYKA